MLEGRPEQFEGGGDAAHDDDRVGAQDLGPRREEGAPVGAEGREGEHCVVVARPRRVGAPEARAQAAVGEG